MVTIELETRIAAPIERCFDLALSVEAHLAGTEASRERAVGGVRTGLMKMGDVVRWEATHFFIRQHLSSEITAYDRPRAFSDEMIEGAFASMHHEHSFAEAGDGVTLMRDRFAFAAPFGILGLLAERLVLRRYMRRLLLERNAALKAIAESERWRSVLPGG